MTGPALVDEFSAAAAQVHEAVLRLQEVLEKATDHAARMRSMSDALNEFKTQMSTPGKMGRLPVAIVPTTAKGEVAAGAVNVG